MTKLPRALPIGLILLLAASCSESSPSQKADTAAGGQTSGAEGGTVAALGGSSALAGGTSALGGGAGGKVSAGGVTVIPGTSRGGSSAGGAGGGATTGGARAESSAGGTASGGGGELRSTGGASGGARTSAQAGTATSSTGGSSAAVDAVAIAKAMGFGANIGNTLENTTTWETGWGQPLITQTFINGMASRGIKTVRVPVAWDTYASNGVINPDKMNRVKEVVGWILAAGMYAIVNIHWDGGWIFNESNANKYRLTDDVKTKFASYWEQISKAFAAVGPMLIFEGLNEEAQFYANGTASGAPDIAALNTLNQLFVTTVRAQTGHNATRALLIAGFATDINKTCVDAFAEPSDPAGAGRLFLSLHYYDPSTFTILEETASWGTPAATWGSDKEKQALESQFTKAANFSASKRIPIIIGEFGVTLGTKLKREPASRILWMTSVAKACFAHGMVPVLWDTGSEIKRSDGSFSSELQAVMANIK